MYLRHVATVNSKVFRSGNSEAVRLPREVAYGSDIDVTVTRSGDCIIIEPVRKRLTPAEIVEALGKLPRPSYVQERESFDWPDRA